MELYCRRIFGAGFRFVIVFAVLVYCFSPCCAAASVSSEFLLGQWTDRARRITSISVKWVEASDFYPRSKQRSPEEDNRPGELIALTGSGRLILVGDNIRFERERAQWLGNDLKVVDRKESQVFTSGDGWKVSAVQSDGDFPSGVVHKASDVFEILSIEVILPLVLDLRITHESFSIFSKDDMIVTNLDERLGVVSTLLVTFRHPSCNIRMWVDVERGYIPVGYQFEQLGGRVLYDLKIDYREIIGEWLPSHWVSTSFDDVDGSIKVVRRVELTDIAINEPVSTNTFRLEFPVGSWVNDVDTGKSYVIRLDGSRGTVSARDTVHDYNTLVETSHGRIRRLLSILFVLLLLGAVCRFLYVRRARA